MAWATDASQQSKVLVIVTLVHTSDESSQAHCFKQMIPNKRFQTTDANQQAEVLVPVSLIVSTSEPFHSHVGVPALENIERFFVPVPISIQAIPILLDIETVCTRRFGRKRRPVKPRSISPRKASEGKDKGNGKGKGKGEIEAKSSDQ